jgi:N-methylhydantoinase B
LESFADPIEEGDVIFTNDPYLCGGTISHLNDWLIQMPIHYKGRLVGWTSMFGHQNDTGGPVPSSLPTDAPPSSASSSPPSAYSVTAETSHYHHGVSTA